MDLRWICVEVWSFVVKLLNILLIPVSCLESKNSIPPQAFTKPSECFEVMLIKSPGQRCEALYDLQYHNKK